MRRALEHTVPFGEALRVWVRVALLSFGGPAGQIAVMHRIVVDEKRWVDEARFLHALNYCMLLPGPEAQQLATYLGWLLHGTRGGLVAGTLFVLPGFLSILALSVLYVSAGESPLVAALFAGLAPAVVAIVVAAVVRIGKRALKSGLQVAIAALAFVAIFFFDVPYPWIVVGAALAGVVGMRLAPSAFTAPRHAAAKAVNTAPLAIELPPSPAPTRGRALRVLVLGLALWFVPIAALVATFGRDHALSEQARFFSQAAVVTFGGAYSVLAYVAQQAVDVYGWLAPGEMLDGLAMAETTPGPLIQVVQFVGFMGAYRQPGDLEPMTAALLGAVVTTWVTFVPCFLWIFLGAPYVERLRGRPRLDAALSAITAAVVGVVLNLSLWFALHSFFTSVATQHIGPLRLFVPDFATVQVVPLVLAIGAGLALVRFKVGLVKTLVACVLVGGAHHLMFA
jgi:chromate transporter